MNILEVKDLCKTYIVNKRQNNVLKNINFTIGEGEMVAVMGPSGSGKSTLLYTAGKRRGAVRISCAGWALSTLPTTTSMRFRAVSSSGRASAAV